jgi:hypothetical protein
MTTRLAFAATAALVVLPALAFGQQVRGFNAHGYDPTYAGDRFFASPDATVDGHLLPSVKLTVDYAYGSLRLMDVKTGQLAPGGRLLRDQLYVNLDAALTLLDRVEVAVGLPFAAFQSGESVLAGTKTAGSALSDLRLGARVGFVGKPREAWALGMSADLFVPVGSAQDFAGDTDARGHVRLIASGQVGLAAQTFLWSAALGAMIRAHHDVGLQEVGTAVTYSAAAGMLLLDKKLQIGPELSARSPRCRATRRSRRCWARATASPRSCSGRGSAPA